MVNRLQVAAKQTIRAQAAPDPPRPVRADAVQRVQAQAPQTITARLGG